MVSYEDIRDRQTLPVRQAVENAERDLQKAEKDLAARRLERASLDEGLQALVNEHRALDAPQSMLKREIADIEQRLRDLQRQLEAKRSQLVDYEQQAEGRLGGVKQRRAEIAALERDIERAAQSAEERRVALEGAKERLRASQQRALVLYMDEVFGFLGRRTREATAHERYEAARRAFEAARDSDQIVMRAHEERREVKRLLDSTQLPSLRDLLEQKLREAERTLEERFPGLIAGPPPPGPEEMLETYAWYNPMDDLTSLLLPVPASCWHTPPDQAADPRGGTLCQVVWGFMRALGDPVPTVECEDDLVRLEFHGDHTQRISGKFFEVELAPGQVVSFLAAPLPAEIAGGLQ